MKEIEDWMKEKGFEYSLFDITPIYTEFPRGVEIWKWLKTYNRDQEFEKDRVSDYLILDDDGDMLLGQLEHFVLMDGTVGLTSTMAYRAANLLNRKIFI